MGRRHEARLGGSLPERSRWLAAHTALSVAWVVASCASHPPHPIDPAPAPRAHHAPASVGAYVRVLGTAQDGGFPHVACDCPRCEAARRDPRLARRIASLAIVLPASRQVYLVDATPDLREQMDALRDVRRAVPGGVDRAPVDGVFLTHAHLGHYTGLAFFGFEALHARGVPVWVSPRMERLLRTSGPWSELVRLENISLRALTPDVPVPLGEGVFVTAWPVPHRDELSDTLAFRIEGPRARIAYVPDTDRWDTWAPPLLDRLLGVDVALLDGTFHDLTELPGRDVTKIGHPLVTATMDLLEERVRQGRVRVFFTHLNHSNRALGPGAEERRAMRSRGFDLLEDGREFPL